MYKNKAGFTLIELLVVVAIIGILAVAAITAYTGVQLKASRSEAYTNLEMIRMLQEQVFADSGCYEGLVGGACPDPGNTYTCDFAAVDTNNDGIICNEPNEIATLLPRFRPGPGRKFDYEIRVAPGVGLPNPVPVPYVPGVTAALADPATPCFIATATGAVGKVAEGPDVFAVDCNNNRNF